MKKMKLKIKTKVSLIIILSLIIVEMIFLFPSLNNRRQIVIDEQVAKINLLTDVMSGQPDIAYLEAISEELKKHHITKLVSSDIKKVKTTVAGDTLTFFGNGFEVQMDLGWIEKEVRRYAFNIIGITLILVFSVTLISFIFLARNKTIQKAETAEERAIELESENIKQNKILQDIINASTGMATNLVSSTDELKKTSYNLSENVTSQAASIEEISTALEEVFVSTELIATKAAGQARAMKNADEMMVTLSGTSAVTTEQAKTAMARTIETQSAASEGERNVANALHSMNEIQDTTKRVSEILTIIEDISDRVNLLSLNAAIEAARAGAMGRGFAIVADEIGKLADQTAQSTKDITGLVKMENDKVVAGTKTVETLANSFLQINQNIKLVDDALQTMVEAALKTDADSKEMKKTVNSIQKTSDEISTSTTEQNITGQAISKSLDEINHRVQSIAQTAREFASFIESVAGQAEKLLLQVKKA